MGTDRIVELERKISELENQLKIEKEKQGTIEDIGLWEYDIASRRLIQTRKLQGEWSNNNLTVENYREQMKEWDLIHPEDIPLFDEYCDSLDRGDAHVLSELRFLRDSGHFALLRYEGRTIYDEEGNPIRVVGQVTDITDEKAEKELLEREVTRDFLTGLYEHEVATKMIEKKLGESEEERGALLLMDIDNFKYINDTYGQVYGDSVLEKASNVIYTSFRMKDIVGRISGDIFLVYCSGAGDEHTVERLINKVFLRFQSFMEERDGKKCSISVGAALYPRDGKTYQELFCNADIALLETKKSGKNKFHIYQKDRDYGTCLGEVYRKLKDEDKRKLSTEKKRTNLNKELFDFAFKVISSEADFYHAIYLIFEEVSLYFSLDRSTLMEWDAVKRKIRVTSRWTREDDGDDVIKIEQTGSTNWFILEKYYRNIEYNILDKGKDEREDYSDDVYAMNKIPVSAIQFPIMDGSKMAGVLTFECWKERKWNLVEINTLSSITKMISSYLLQRQVKAELETEYIIGKKAMDILNQIYYVIEEDTYKILYMSRYAQEQYPNAEYGQVCYQAVMGKDAPCDSCPLCDYQRGKDDSTVEIYDPEDDNWYTMTASYMGKTQGVNQILVCKSNVTDFLKRVKGVDQLTGVMSYEKFRMETAKALIKEREKRYVLIFMGIQDFSRINDEYGYETGDLILKAFAEAVQSGLEEKEFFCRIKGDDFVALTDSSNYGKGKYKTMGELSEDLSRQFRDRFPNISIKCFAGVYRVPEGEEYISRCFDKAMKARKMALSNMYDTGGIYVYTREFELQEKERERINRAMKDSLEKGYFRVFIQPKVNILTNEITGGEALVRMIDADGNLVSPGKFIPLAEENGMIVEIDKYVYRETFRLIRKWQDEGKKVPLISINISRLHLRNDELPVYLKQLSDQYGVSPNQVELEITESVFFEDTERLIKVVKQMKDMGFVISMDDFGAGFSTLSLMKSLPVDIIKLDGGFFLKNELDYKNKAVISAIMRLAENLGFETISEGVETEEQVEFVREQGGKYVQGFYFYKPMPADEFSKLI